MKIWKHAQVGEDPEIINKYILGQYLIGIILKLIIFIYRFKETLKTKWSAIYSFFKHESYGGLNFKNIFYRI